MNEENFKWIKSWFDKHVSISDNEWIEFISYFKQVTLKKNDYYLKAGAFTNKVGLLKTGILRAFNLKENGETLTHYFYHTPLTTLVTLYEAYTTNTPNDFSVEALTDVILFEIEKEDLEILFEKFPDLDKLKIMLAENHYFYDKQRINSLQNQSAKERYCEFIKKTGDLVLQVPQNMIASYLGISQFTLSKIKGKC
jgi:CRP-like cAMP-binding protein